MEGVEPAGSVPSAGGVWSRLVGVLVAPKTTFMQVAREPRWLGMLALIITVYAACGGWLTNTVIGRQAVLDESVRLTESFGFQLTDQQYDTLRRAILGATTGRVLLQAALAPLVIWPLVVAVCAGSVFAIFTAGLGGGASFRQVVAVVVHSAALLAVKQLVATPIAYASESLSNPTTLAVFFPMLDESSVASRALGSIDLFVVWAVIAAATGLAVLYERRTRVVAGWLLAIYAVLIALFLLVRGALGGFSS